MGVVLGVYVALRGLNRPHSGIQVFDGPSCLTMMAVELANLLNKTDNFPLQCQGEGATMECLDFAGNLFGQGPLSAAGPLNSKESREEPRCFGRLVVGW